MEKTEERQQVRKAIMVPEELHERIQKMAVHHKRKMVQQLEVWVEREEEEAAAE